MRLLHSIIILVSIVSCGEVESSEVSTQEMIDRLHDAFDETSVENHTEGNRCEYVASEERIDIYTGGCESQILKARTVAWAMLDFTARDDYARFRAGSDIAEMLILP